MSQNLKSYYKSNSAFIYTYIWMQMAMHLFMHSIITVTGYVCICAINYETHV